MPASSSADLHGNAPDKSSVALLLIDVINDLDFDGSEALLEHALPLAQRIAALKQRAREASVPAVYVNDNFGQWRSDFAATVAHCLNDGVPGEPIARLLAPDEHDYFVLKPKHSGFFTTSLDLLLNHVGAKTLILTGMAGDICILFTAGDAYLRDYRLFIPRDCVASNTKDENDAALKLMAKVVKADVRPSDEIDFTELLDAGDEDQSD
jgi:nicotinamidase-related amidase